MFAAILNDSIAEARSEKAADTIGISTKGQTTIYKTYTRTPLKTVPAPLVTPVVLI
jgi:hypothetical protein